MEQDNPTLKNAQKTGKTPKGFSEEEKAAIKARAREQKAEAEKVEGGNAVLAAIAEMQEPDRSMATRVHELIQASAPDLAPKTWYGMPAYAKDGKIICFFQPAQKFKTRYATFGFNDTANLDQGALWPVAFAIREMTPTVEARIVELVKKATS